MLVHPFFALGRIAEEDGGDVADAGFAAFAFFSLGDDDEFVVFTEPSKPKVKKFFRTVDATPQLTRLVEALREILEADPEIREVVWSEPGK